MMESRRVGGFGDVHPKINAVDHHLQYGSDNSTPARAAGHQPGFPVFYYDSRRHRRQWTFLRPNRVSIAAHQSINVRHARLGREIIHLIIEQNAGVTRHNASSEGGIQGIGHCHGIAVFIYHREVSGLVAFIGSKFARLDLAGRLRFVDINLIGKRFSISFVGQRLPRHFHKIRVAKIFGTVGIGIFFCFSHYLHGISAAKPVLFHIEIFENVEDLNDMNPPGRWRRHRENLITTVVTADWRTLYGFVVS